MERPYTSRWTMRSVSPKNRANRLKATWLSRSTRLISSSSQLQVHLGVEKNFTPARKIQVEFNQITLPSGKHVVVHTTVTPGSGNVVEFVSAADEHQGNGVKDAAAERTREAKQQVKQEWHDAMREVKEPGKMHRLGLSRPKDLFADRIKQSRAPKDAWRPKALRPRIRGRTRRP